MPYRMAEIDVHKKMLAVAMADVAAEGEWRFERRQFGTGRRNCGSSPSRVSRVMSKKS